MTLTLVLLVLMVVKVLKQHRRWLKHLSGDVDKVYCRTLEVMSKKEEGRQFERLTKNWTHAAVNARVVTRSFSVPETLDQVKRFENSMFFKSQLGKAAKK